MTIHVQTKTLDWTENLECLRIYLNFCLLEIYEDLYQLSGDLRKSQEYARNVCRGSRRGYRGKSFIVKISFIFILLIQSAA